LRGRVAVARYRIGEWRYVEGTRRVWLGLSDVGFGFDAGRPLRDKGPDRGAKA
jgi:hypothetical protein